MSHLPLTAKIPEDPYYQQVETRIQGITLALGGSILLFSLIFLSAAFAASFFISALISHLNFVWMRQVIDRLLATVTESSQSQVLVDLATRESLGGIGQQTVGGPEETNSSEQAQGTRIGSVSIRGVMFKYFLRYGLMGITLYAIFRFQFFDVRGAILGLCLMIVAIMFECAYQVIKTLIEDIPRGRA